MRHRYTASIGLVIAAGAVAVALAAARVGPAKGTLVLDGGLELSATVAHRFAELAGGDKARIVLIPTAAGNAIAQDPATLATYRTLFGAGCCTVLHTLDRAVADRADFAATLKDATGVWMTAGAAPTLSDVYWHTATERAIRDVLDRGGVVGGSSAGAVIQGARIPTQRPNNTFAFLRNTILWAHVDQGRVKDMLVAQVMANPQWLGLGIAERTAAIVKGDDLEVVGDGEVIVVDGKTHNKQPYAVLHAGEHITLKPR